MSAQINWENFEANNPDVRGIQHKFEDLCRQIFENEFLSSNDVHKYLHCNPNNPGVEADPVLDEKSNEKISFQAKYFETESSSAQYSQIRHSAEQTIKYYEGQIDRIYLYSNKTLTVTSTGYKDVESLFSSHDIELTPVTNEMILDLVRKYPYLELLYFGSHTVNLEWFERCFDNTLFSLGDRYNQEFNVSTKCSEFFSIFVHDKIAADLFNSRKSALITRIHELNQRGTNSEYLYELEKAVNNLDDVSADSIASACAWKATVSKKVASYLLSFEKEHKKLDQEIEDTNLKIDEANAKREDTQNLYRRKREINIKISGVEDFYYLPDALEITSDEQSLINGKVLLLHGEAGTGKSQLLAHESRILLDEGRAVLLLNAGIYATAEPVQDQIVAHLQIGYRFGELLDVLEAYGERYNFIIPIFIDALNESWYKDIWTNGIADIISRVYSHQMLRLVLSYRSEYEKLLLPDNILANKNRGDIVSLKNSGFEKNSVEAVKKFLNHFSIPFTPTEFFGIEFENPLFLTLYCKTYNGKEVNLLDLYERLIINADETIFKDIGNALREKGYFKGDGIIEPFIEQFSSAMLASGRRSVNKKELRSLPYWNDMGISCGPFIKSLVRNKLLYTYVDGNDEYYHFSYDQMLDYYSAKTIFSQYSDKVEVRRYLRASILDIHNGELGNPENIDLFVMSCALYSERYGEECIDLIDAISGDDEKMDVFSRYITSLQWRNHRFIPKENLLKLVGTYPCSVEAFWQLLIGNSVKVNNPLNADFLHSFLQSYSLADRDYRWTLYINQLSDDNSDRLVQIIIMYDRGDSLDIHSEKQKELLLTLFGWVLTSSNRWLRDRTSKAMIEILKKNFNLCKPLLEKFKDVNDPYVIQRLYGIVFGACCKRRASDIKAFQVLAEFVYNTVFNQKNVFPDILLRDYARLIIERFLYEKLEYTGIIDRDRIIPPYNSDPIPNVPDGHYQDKEYDGGEFWIMHSMRFENFGGYGDFGRYVYQSALSDFEVDEYKIYNFSIYHIFNDLKYSEKYFGEYDRQCGRCERHQAIKSERIGKKYQWITMMEVLARVADHCQMVDRWNYPKKQQITYEGAWEPDVRDFDPTLNASFMNCGAAPVFNVLDDFSKVARMGHGAPRLLSPELKRKWVESRGPFLGGIKNTLLLKDDKGIEWVTLTCFNDTDRKRIKTDKRSVWSRLYAYFVTEEQKKEFIGCAKKGLSVITNETASYCETYTVYNREYPWASSCNTIKNGAWVDISLPTGDFEIVTEKAKEPDFPIFNDLLAKNAGKSGVDEPENSDVGDTLEFETVAIKYKEVTRERKVQKNIGKILHATCSLLWEDEYDASKDEAISWDVPCPELCESLHLNQLEADGFYFDESNQLAAFDVELTQGFNRLVIRKDLLDGFLNENNFQLIWLVDAQKEIFGSDIQISDWSNWQAVYSYENGSIAGDLQLQEVHSRI